MKFVRSEYAFLGWLLLPLLGLLIYAYRKRLESLKNFSQTRFWSEVAPKFSIARRQARIALVFTASVLLFLALLRPQWGFDWVPVRDVGSDLMVVVDVSNSMRASDLKPDRLERARREIIDLLDVLKGERIGLVAFAGLAHMLCPLTEDYNTFTLFLDYLDTDLIPIQGTDLGVAMQTALNGFDKESRRNKTVLLITDGEDHGSSVEESIRLAKEMDVPVYIVGIGSTEGVPIPSAGGFRKDESGQLILSKLAEADLVNIAKATGGGYSRSVAGDLDLETIYRGGIAKRQSSEDLEDGRKRRYKERFQPFVFFALILLLIDWAMPGRKVNGKAASIAAMLFLCFCLPAQAGPLSRGTKAYQQKEYQRSVEQFSQGQLDQPDDAKIHYNLGNSLYRLGRFKEATREFESAATTEDEDLKQRALFNMGNSLFNEKQFKEAIEKYDAALEIAPKDEDAQTQS